MTSKSMWAHRLVAPERFELLETRAPVEDDLGDGEVLLRVLVGGVCGSDIPFFRGKPSPLAPAPAAGGPPDSPPGSSLHEVVGEVVASRDALVPAGVNVVGWAGRMNGLAEYVIVNGAEVAPYAPGLAPNEAILLQPLACVIYAVDALRDIAGTDVTVIGQGPIGVLFSHVLKSRGAAHVTGVDRVDRSDWASTFGVDEALAVTSDRWSALVAAGAVRRPGIVVEAVGHQVSTLTDAVHAVGEGGQIYYFGIPDDPVYPFPMAEFLRKNARLLSGFTTLGARRDVLRRADQYLAEHPELAKGYVSHRYPFAQATEAFTTASRASQGRLKVILEA